MLKGYFGEEGAQIHFRKRPAMQSKKRPLICLAPSPHTGLSYTNIMEGLAEERDVYAVDYPGFGGSDPLPVHGSVESYALSLVGMIKEIGPVDLMGFHTGCLIGLELGLIEPDLIHKIIMIDIPYFEAEQRAILMDQVVKATPYPNNISDLESSLGTQVSKRADDLGLGRAYDLWVEVLRAGEGQNDLFRAAFLYDCEGKFAELQKHVNIIATTSGLLESSRIAATKLANAEIKEQLQITRAVFELGADLITEEILTVLND